MPFNSASHTEIISKSAAVTGALTPELYAYLISLLPTPHGFNDDHERLEASFTASLKGDSEKIKACEADRNTVNQNLTILLGLAKAVSVKDPTVLEKLGLGHVVERTTAAAALPGIPKDFRVTFDKEGRPVASLTKLSGAKGYEIWICDGDPSVEDNWRMLTWSTSCQKIPLPGMNRAKTNFLRIRGKRNNIVGPWSHYISVDPA